MAIRIARILVPIDFSDQSEPVVEWASHLAQEHGSKIWLLHAYHLPVERAQVRSDVDTLALAESKVRHEAERIDLKVVPNQL